MAAKSYLFTLTTAVFVISSCSKEDSIVGSKTTPTPQTGGLLNPHSTMANAPVTEKELSQFTIQATQLISLNQYGSGNQRAVQSMTEIDTIPGDSCGFSIFHSQFSGDEEKSTGSGTMNLALFDYSNDNQIFFGGAIKVSAVMSESKTEIIAKGTTPFTVAYAGTIIYNVAMNFEKSMTVFPVPTGSIQLISGGKTFELLDSVAIKIMITHLKQ